MGQHQIPLAHRARPQSAHHLAALRRCLQSPGRGGGSVQEARNLYFKGIEARKLALGTEGFEQYTGHFWGFLETRPYMRARAGLAIALIKLGEDDAAIGHFHAMLELNTRASAIDTTFGGQSFDL